jgi:5-methylcytosine-specific restriction endonuclease McrA
MFPSKKIQNKTVHTAHRHREPRYHTTAWRALRESVLRDEPLCRQCRDNGIIMVAQMVDHINPVRLGGSFNDCRQLATPLQFMPRKKVRQGIKTILILQ